MNPRRPSGPTLRLTSFGTPVYVNWSLPFFGAGIAYIPAVHSGHPSLAAYLTAFFSLVALLIFHEVGHAMAAKACSLRVISIVLSGYGGCCVFEAPRRLSHAALIAAGGLIAQFLVLAVVVALLLLGGPSKSIVLNSAVFVLVGANIAFMLVNIAPFQGSDGANLLAIAKQALSQRRGSGT